MSDPMQHGSAIDCGLMALGVLSGLMALGMTCALFLSWAGIL